MNDPALYIVATPIGNLEDLTVRARRVLETVGLVAAEDTRQTRKLLTHLGISRPLISYREQNRREASAEVLATMAAGVSAALVTDAGTPGISDPGHYLVARAVEAGYRVVPIPGASAMVAAISASGLPLDRFLFEGFLPSRPGARRSRLRQLAREGYALILYESPRRLHDTLEDIRELLGDRRVVVARELTKLHEEFLRGSCTQLLDRLDARPVKGEVTLLVEGGERPLLELELQRAVSTLRKEGLSAARVASLLSALTGMDRKRIYRAAVEDTPVRGKGDRDG